MSYHKALNDLLLPAFESKVVTSSSRALRTLLLRTDEVGSLRAECRSGTVSSAEMQSFVELLLSEFPPPGSFPHQSAIAAIAVVVEDMFTPFAKKFLVGLARVESARLRMSVSVARLCMQNRSRRPATRQKNFQLAAPPYRFFVTDLTGTVSSCDTTTERSELIICSN